MADEPKRSFWQTLPGILTALGATITALTGLVVAVQQFLHTVSDSPRLGTAPTVIASTAGAPATAPAVIALDGHSTAKPAAITPASTVPTMEAEPGHVTASTPPGAAPTSEVVNAALKGQKRLVGRFSYEILSASIERVSGWLTLHLHVRKTAVNWAGNFMDADLRLIADGVWRAPYEGPNLIVPDRASIDGDFAFVLPREAKTLEIEVNDGADQVDTIPLVLQLPVASVSPAPTPSSPAAAALINAATGQHRRVGRFVYEILSTVVERRGADTQALIFEVRKTGGDSAGNFMTDDFRLIVDGARQAPVEGPNLIVPWRGSVEGSVVFLVPAAAQQIALELYDGPDFDSVPLQGSS